MQIRITRGKGAKDRLVPLSPRLLTELRDVLETVQTQLAALSGQVSRQDLLRHLDPKGDQEVRRTSQDSQERHAAHAETLLRDGTTRSRSGLADDQPTAGSRQLRDDDGLSALPPRTFSISPQSTGLVTGADNCRRINHPRRSGPATRGPDDRRVRRKANRCSDSAIGAAASSADTPTCACSKFKACWQRYRCAARM